MTDYVDVLDKKNEELKKGKDSYKRAVDTISYIESFIPEFFSKDGEEQGIRNMYKDLRVAMESVFYDKKVPCADIHHGHGIYKEYLEGMTSFINDIQNMDESLELESFEEKFSTAREKDSIFIKSLYGGKLNPIEDTELFEATGNVEFLIDFIPDLSVMKEQCKEYSSRSMDIDTDKGRLFKESVDMLCDSISDYCYNTIRNVITTYESIQKSLSGEDVVTESVEPKVPFVLF